MAVSQGGLKMYDETDNNEVRSERCDAACSPDAACDSVAADAVEPTADAAELDAAPAADPVADARAAAEEEARKAEETAEFRAAAAEKAEESARAAVEELSASAGFVTRAGAYYDVRAAKVAAAAAVAAAGAAKVAARKAAALESAAAPAAGAAGAAGIPEGSDASADTPAALDDLGAADLSADLADSDSDADVDPVDSLDPEVAASDSAEDDSYVDDIAFSRQVARLTEAVARQSLHREIFYKTLVFCTESRPLAEIEQQIASYPEFKHAANNPYHFVQVLENAGGLERFELDEEGEVVGPERKEGLTEDEVDDLVAGYAFMTTAVGLAVVEQHTPRARIIELLNLVPERADTYIELLDFCSEEPRTYSEISQLLKGRPALVRMVDGEPQTMQPSVFVDKLEAAGGMVWRDGWVLTDEGRAYLAELRESV